MKLAFLIDSTRKIGGGTYAQYVFARTLALRGHEVMIFAGDKNFYSHKLNVENLKVYYRTSIPGFIKGIGINTANKLLMNAHIRLIYKPLIKKFQPDWLIGYLRTSAISAQTLGEQLDVKVANFVYETPEWMEQQLGEKLPPKLLKSWSRTKTAYTKSTVLIPNSLLSGSFMKKWIPQAVISEPVYPGINRNDIDLKQTKKRDVDIIYIGRLNKLKNVDDLLYACDSKQSIVILGAGDESSRLQEIASKRRLNITFLGSVSDEVKWDYLQRSKLLVSPTSFEGFGMPPLEALASGCKVLCTDIPIYREVYGQEVTYFELHNVNQLREKIINLINHPGYSQSQLPMRYTWDQSATTIEKILGNYS